MFAKMSQAKPKDRGRTPKRLGRAALCELNRRTNNKMAKKTFYIPTRLVFTGSVEVLADDREKAECLVQHVMGAMLGDVSDSGDENVVNWGFPMHSDVELITDEDE